MPTDEEITAAMRRFHQMRREVVLGMIGVQQENGTPPNQTEVNELLTQIKQTDERCTIFVCLFVVTRFLVQGP